MADIDNTFTEAFRSNCTKILIRIPHRTVRRIRSGINRLNMVGLTVGPSPRAKSTPHSHPPRWDSYELRGGPDCELWLLQCDTGQTLGPLEELLCQVPYLECLAKRDPNCCVVVDARTGVEVLRVPGAVTTSTAPNGQALLVQRRDGSVELRNGPVQKPWRWLGIAVAIWALPLTWFAHLRSRRFAPESRKRAFHQRVGRGAPASLGRSGK